MSSSQSGPEITRLIALLAKLPGLGPRSARRAALHLIKKKSDLMQPLGQAILDAAESIVTCGTCGNIDSQSPCHICAAPGRDKSVICVVQEVGDLWALERAAVFRGQYHVLGGSLSALEGVRPEDLNIAGLITRAAGDEVKEIILATNATVDGQTTAHYITDKLGGANVSISRLAHGVPVGGELDYMDDGTLATALSSRRPF